MLNELVRGSKYTVVVNDGYLEFNIKIILVDYIYKQYGQFEDVPFIKFKREESTQTFSIYLDNKYAFIDGWHDINMCKKIEHNTYTRIKYDDLEFENIKGFIFKGQVGTTQINKDYESLIDYSLKLYWRYIFGTTKYLNSLKTIFTKRNYSYSDDMIKYYYSKYPYFLDTLNKIVN